MAHTIADIHQAAEIAAAFSKTLETWTREWTDEQREAYIAIYRLLAKGAPVDAADLAADQAMTRDKAQQLIAQAGGLAKLDDEGSIIGFSGLTLKPTRHRLDTIHGTVHVWCALDAYFITGLLGSPTTVTSTDPVTGTPVTIDIDATGRPARGADTAATLVLPKGDRIPDDIMAAVCDHVAHFESAESAAAYDHGEPLVVVTAEDLADTAQEINRKVWRRGA